MKLTPDDQAKLRDKELANIIRKLNGGKTLTAREEAKLSAATAGGQIDATGYVGTWDDLGQRLGVTRRAIQDWRHDPRYREKCPRDRDDGRKEVAAWLGFMVAHGLKRGAASEDAADDLETTGGDPGQGIILPPRYGGSQGDWTKAKIAKDVERKDIEIESIRGTLLVAAELEVPLGATFATIQMKLAQFPSRVARYLVGLVDVSEVEDRLRDEIDADLSDLHAARYTAADAIAEAVAAVPFDELLKQDRAALQRLITSVATEALRQLGRRAISGAGADTRAPQTSSANAEPAPAAPAKAAPSSVEKSRTRTSGKATSGRKSRSRPKPASAPPEVEAAIHAQPRRKKTRRR